MLRQCKRHEINIVMGDLIAKVGQGKVDQIIRPYVLGEKTRGDRFVKRCLENKQVVTNTYIHIISGICIYGNHPEK